MEENLEITKPALSEAEIERRRKLGESTKNTRFGVAGGNKTAGQLGINTRSFRSAARQMAGQKVKYNSKGEAELPLPAEPTAAQVAVAAAYKKANKGNIRALEYLTEQVDGKVANVNLNAEMAKISEMSDDEIARELDALRQAAEGINATPGGDEPEAETSNVGGEIGGSGQTDDASSSGVPV